MEPPERTKAWSKDQGKSPLKLKDFSIEMSNTSGIFGPFWEFWELKKTMISLNWLSVRRRGLPNPVLWAPSNISEGASAPSSFPCLCPWLITLSKIFRTLLSYGQYELMLSYRSKVIRNWESCGEIIKNRGTNAPRIHRQ